MTLGGSGRLPARQGVVPPEGFSYNFSSEGIPTMHLLAAHEARYHHEFVGRPLTDPALRTRLLYATVAVTGGAFIIGARARIAYGLMTKRDAMNWLAERFRSTVLGGGKPSGFIRVFHHAKSHFLFTLFNDTVVKISVEDAAKLLLADATPLADPFPPLLAAIREQRRRVALLASAPRNSATYRKVSAEVAGSNELVHLVLQLLERRMWRTQAKLVYRDPATERPSRRRLVFTHPVAEPRPEVGLQPRRLAKSLAG